MTIEFKNKKMVVTHSSGVIDTFETRELMTEKTILENSRNSISSMLAEIENQILLTEQSSGSEK